MEISGGTPESVITKVPTPNEDHALIGDVAEAQILKASIRSNSSGDLELEKMHLDNEQVLSARLDSRRLSQKSNRDIEN